jgi:hypothetical protein
MVSIKKLSLNLVRFQGPSTLKQDDSDLRCLEKLKRGRICMQASKIGIFLCSFYAIIIIACICFTLSGSSDNKGRYVFLQLPIAIQMDMVVKIGLAPWLEHINWLMAYILLASPTFFLLYGLGYVIENIINHLK